jgi:hypothetical protein
MAKIVEENIVIKISSIIKDGEKDAVSHLSEELLSTVETVVTEMIGSGVVVEVVAA